MMVLFCNECGHEVRPHRNAVSCGICSGWQHINCGTGINRDVYRAAVRGERGPVSFECQSCSPQHLQNTEEDKDIVNLDIQKHAVTSTPPSSPSSQRTKSENRTIETDPTPVKVMVPTTDPPTTTTPPRSPRLPKNGTVTTTKMLESLLSTVMLPSTAPEDQQLVTSTPLSSPKEPDITPVVVPNRMGDVNTVIELVILPTSPIVTSSEQQTQPAVHIPELDINSISLGEVSNSSQTENRENPQNGWTSSDFHFSTNSDDLSTCRQYEDNISTIQMSPQIRWPSSVFPNKSDVPGIRRNTYAKFKRIEMPQFDRSFFSDMSPEASFEDSNVTHIKDATLTYTVVQKESGKDLLIDSHGYTYSVKINNEVPTFSTCHPKERSKVEKTSRNLNNEDKVAPIIRRSNRIRTKQRQTISTEHLHFKQRHTNDLSTVQKQLQSPRETSMQISNQVQTSRPMVEDECSQIKKHREPLVVRRSNRIRAKYRPSQLQPPRETPMEADQDCLGGNDEDRPF